ncbi:MAG: NADH-quinone oxidoreductase subunit N [Aggregatilineales bacterium]
MPEFNFLQHLPAIAPEVGLTFMAIVILLLDSYLPEKLRPNIAFVSAIGMAFLAITPFIWAAVYTPEQVAAGENLLWGGMIRHDALAQIFKVMILLGGAITSLIAYSDSGTKNRGEFHLIIVIATLGGCLMAGAADLIMVFVALETLSIPLYILATFNRDSSFSAESGLKYFLFGSFASAIMLYGFSLLYGFSGTTDLQGIATAMNTGVIIGDNIFPVLIATVMVVVGFGFKVGAVPFHFWTPDVYEGAPTPVTAYISVASKAASFALLVRFLIYVFGIDESLVAVNGQTIQTFWVGLVSTMAVLSMTFGNVLALRQTNIKRLLAYSSIAQAGYVLVGVASLQATSEIGLEFSISSVAFYMFMYTFSNLVVFAGIVLVTESLGSEEIADLAGLQRRNPWIALTMTIGLLSLGGIPPTAGFIGKLFLFQAAVEANLVGLAILGVLNAIIALYYYLVVVKIMYVDETPDERAISVATPYAWVLGITAIVVVLLGTFAVSPIMDWAREGAAAVAALSGAG